MAWLPAIGCASIDGFLIRDSVDHVAGRLDVTRYTIYNYLGEVRGRPALRRLRANRDTEPPVRRSRRAALTPRPNRSSAAILSSVTGDVISPALSTLAWRRWLAAH
jgi:hypothetical protein